MRNVLLDQIHYSYMSIILYDLKRKLILTIITFSMLVHILMVMHQAAATATLCLLKKICVSTEDCTTRIQADMRNSDLMKITVKRATCIPSLSIAHFPN